MKRLMFILIVLASAAGCTLYTMEESLLPREDISLTWKGDVQVSYESSSSQMGFNDARNEYRIYSDVLADWFVLKCSERPAGMDHIFQADVSWTGKKSTMTKTGIEFKVVKTDEQGKIWLWNESDKIGIIIKDIQ